MPLLPQPSTVSPGRLVLRYHTGALEHEIGTNLTEGADMTDIPSFRSAAQAFRDIIKDQLTNVSGVLGWKITDLTGVSLYEEDFPEEAIGVKTVVEFEYTAQSCTLTLTGKGRPPIGLAQGQTKVVFFPGTYQVNAWDGNHVALDAGNISLIPLKEWLTGEDLVGADHYGVKATWRNYMVVQINAHYQKNYGL